MNDPAIHVQDLWKRYRIGQKKSDNLSDSLWNTFQNLFKKQGEEHFWALKELNFEINKGEAIGIIGTNGAGKSTLLKILSRITYPTKGKVVIEGRVASLLEVGTGFHPELTGKQNIFLNGAILGMTRAEIKEKYDEIVDFSGAGKFIETPLKHYSTGMRVRLAFSVAAHLETEILIVDEVLAVGDAEFQMKCLGKMENLNESGRTVLFVSHNLSAVKHLCDKALLLDEGKMASFGESSAIISSYLNKYQVDGEWKKVFKNRQRDKIEFTSIELVSEGNKRKLLIGNAITIRIKYHIIDHHYVFNNCHFSFYLRDTDQNIVIHHTTKLIGVSFSDEEIKKSAHVDINIQDLNIKPGIYTIGIDILQANECLENEPSAIKLRIFSNPFLNYKTDEFKGIYLPMANWNIHQ